MPLNLSVSREAEHLPAESPDETFTPHQRALIRTLIRDEHYHRDRATLLKLLGLITLAKLVGSLGLGALYLLYRWLV
ncbi:hypothetical protein [Serratia fonticola]